MDSVTDQWEQSKKIRSPVFRHFRVLIGDEDAWLVQRSLSSSRWLGGLIGADIQSPDLKVLTSQNKADIKRNTSHSITGRNKRLALLCFSPLAEVLQVRDVIWYDHVNPHVLLFAAFCACKMNPRKTNVSIFNGSQTFILSNLIQF